jgi:hypothetical protein
MGLLRLLLLDLRLIASFKRAELDFAEYYAIPAIKVVFADVASRDA